MPFLYIKEDEDLHTMVTDGSSRLKPGMELVLTRWIALSGTAKLAEGEGSGASETLSGDFGAGSPAFFRAGKHGRDAEACQRGGNRSEDRRGENDIIPLGEGGTLKALWEIADRASLGLKRGASQTSDPPGNHRDHGTF